MSDQPLIGRSAELARLRALTDPDDPGAEHALVLLGDAGLGKSALLTELAGHASARGRRLLCAAGRERETAFAFGGLHQVLDHTGRGPDRFAAGAALLTLLARLAGDPKDPTDPSEPGDASAASGVLVLIDDAQWLDSASLDVLAFAARRLGLDPDTRRGRVAMVVAARGDLPPAGFERGFPELRLDPLTGADANDLLDAQDNPPQGRARAQVLAQADGNPLALIELARAVTADPAAAQRWAALPLPLTDRLRAQFAAPLRALPAPTRHALLLAAVADGADQDAIARSGTLPDPAVLAPAEELGLITLDRAGVRFRHPLIRSAAYHDAPFARRAAAHREVAGLLSGQPDRRAWHLGAAALRPDEPLASLLAATAPRARRRCGATAAALALERAADLSPDPAGQARRLVAAAEAAAPAGQTEWARDLATRALALTRDRDLRARARYVAGWALAWSGRYASSARTLLTLAGEAARDDPGIAWQALGLAATAAYQAGTPEGVRAVADTLAALPPPTAADEQASAARLWALTVSGQNAQATSLLRLLRRTPAHEHALSHLGAAAWLLDQTSDAIEALRGARSALAEPDTRAASGGPLAPLGWAYLDAGRWDDALELTTAQGLGTHLGTDIAPAAARLITATIEAARGDTGHARTLIAAAAPAGTRHSRLITARAWHALGLCALADGDYLTAFGHLRQLFADDGSPYHYHASYLAVGDLALAAARAGHRLEGRELLKQIAAALASPCPRSPRLQQLFSRADWVLADPATPRAYTADAIDGRDGDPAGDPWPFERAKLDLELGEWLRRRRRINQAKPVLRTALEAFAALRARPWERRAESELRACGVAVPKAPGAPGPPGAPAGSADLSKLTPQQRRILELAAAGLSNQEIAERLFLSPRTVSSHLYRSFPTLGVAGRHQLQSLFGPA